MSADNTDTFKACRTCGTFYLSTSDYLRSIYSPTMDPPEVSLIPNELTLWNIGISENDGFPQDICTICIEEFVKIFKFKTACFNTQLQFKRIYTRDTKQHNNAGLLTNIKTEIKREPSLDRDFIILDGMSDSETEQIDNIHEFLQSYNPLTSIKEEKNVENAIEREEKNGYHDEVQNDEMEEQTATNVSQESLPVLDLAPSTSFMKDEYKIESFELEHDSEKPISKQSCNYCIYHENDNTEKQLFSSTSSLHEHKEKKHSTEKPYTCTYCLKTFFSINNCNVHVKYEHSEIFFKSDEIKKRKFKKKLNEKNSFKCIVCQKRLHLKLFQRHMQGHDANEYIKCEQCDFMCRSRIKMRNHLVVVHEKNQNTSTMCNVCGKEFENNTNREKHVWMEHTAIAKEELKQSASDEDPAETTNGDHAPMEYSEDHDKNDITGCTDNILENAVFYTCALCPSSFEDQNNLLLHHNSKHLTVEGTKTNECEICGKTFELKFSLNQHMRRIHGDEDDPNAEQSIESFK